MSGACLHVLAEHEHVVECVAFSPSASNAALETFREVRCGPAQHIGCGALRSIARTFFSSHRGVMV